MHPTPAQQTDADLLHAIARQDEQALAALYDRYRLILFGLAMRILSSREDAEDVLQDVLLQVWRQAAKFDETRGKPFTWLVTLTRSRAIDRLRMIGSLQRTDDAAIRETQEITSDAALDAVNSERRAIVRRALDELPDEQRRTLTLAYFGGLTQSEIAAQLATPLGTVKTRMRTGMMKLRDLLNAKREMLD